MRKLLLLASAVILCAGSAFAGVDPNTYDPSTENGSTIECKNVWLLDRGHFETDYLASIPAKNSAKYRTAAVYDGVIYIGSSLADDPNLVDDGGSPIDCAGVEMYDLYTGAYKGKLKVTIDGVRLSGLLCANQVGVDSFGNLWIAPYVASNANGVYKIYSVNKTTGEGKLEGELPMTENGRIDYCDVIGDITRVQAKCTVMAAAAPPATAAFVYRWVSEKSAAEWEGGWAGGDDSFTITDLYPTGQTAWSYAPVAKIVLGSDAEAYDGRLFYIDGFTTVPTLYDDNGGIIDSFADAPDCVPENAGANGVAEFAIAGRNFIAYVNNQHTGKNGGNEIIVSEMGENMAFAGMSKKWMLPKDGMNPKLVSDGGTRVHSISRELIADTNGMEGVYLLTFKCNAGFGVYLIYERWNSVDDILSDDVKIHIAEKIIFLNREASEIAIFNIQGQLINKVYNTSNVVAPEHHGAYIVRATVAGVNIIKKIII